jgi:lipopolysaccharide transport system ATP-binding protein
MKRTEINQKFDEIVAFSELEKFIDTPVKHYSTGMYLRLAFAVAGHLEPEILLVDEVLAVGDIAFQKKCLGKMGDVANEGRTVLFVSHNMAAIQQLTRTSLLLHEGRVIAEGPTAEVINHYLTTSVNHMSTVYHIDDSYRRIRGLRRQVEFLTLELENHSTKLIPADSEIHLRITVQGNEPVDNFRFSMAIFRLSGSPVGNLFGPDIHSIKKGETAIFRMKLKDLRLAPGQYYCNVAVGKGNAQTGRSEFDHIAEVLHFEITPKPGVNGLMSEWSSSWGSIRFDEPIVARIDEDGHEQIQQRVYG